jgi:hypothetical protein
MLHATTGALKYCGALGSCAAIALCTLYVTRPTAQGRPQADTVANARNASPIYGVTIPEGYRDWHLINQAADRSRKQTQAVARPVGQRYRDKSLSRREAPVPGRRDHCGAALE